MSMVFRHCARIGMHSRFTLVVTTILLSHAKEVRLHAHKVAVVVVVLVEASAPKVYLRVTLAGASILSGSVVRALRGGEGLPTMFCLVASSLGHLRSQCSIVCGSSLQRGYSGSAEGSRRLA